MTNEPPTGDEELEIVEDDLPGWSGPEDAPAESSAEAPPGQPSSPATDPVTLEPDLDEFLIKERSGSAAHESQAEDAYSDLFDVTRDEEMRRVLLEMGDRRREFDREFLPSEIADEHEVEDSDLVYDQLDTDVVRLVTGSQHDEQLRELRADELRERQEAAAAATSPAGGAATSRGASVGSRVMRVVPVVGVAVVLIALVAIWIGGSDAGDQFAASTDGDVASTPAPAGAAAASAPAAAPVASDPPEGYTFCQVHPDEDAAFCRPYYSSTGTKSTLFPASPRRVLEHTITFGAPIPTDPELPLEYKLVISGAAGPTIEQILSGDPGQPLSCVRLVNGAPTADGPEDVCGQITAPDTIYMQADLSAYGEGPLKAEWFAQEIEAGDTLRGDYKDLLGDSGVLMR